NPITGIACCCARAASGHATAAAPPSAASNCRRPMVTVIRPSRARCVTQMIPHQEGAVFTFKDRYPARHLEPRNSISADPPPLKWSDLRYVFDIQEDCNGKEAIQA